MILGWRSPINPLNSGQPQLMQHGAIRLICHHHRRWVGTRSSGAAVIRSEPRWPRGPDIGHLITFTTPHLHNVNNHNKHEHIPQLNVFWILLRLRQYYSIFSLGNKEGDRSGPHPYQLIYAKCINNPASCCFVYLHVFYFILERHILSTFIRTSHRSHTFAHILKWN